MKFHDIAKKKPKNGQWCFLKEKTENGKRTMLFTQPQQWDASVECFLAHPRVIAWAPVPPHVIDNPRGWFSTFRGDDLPDRYAECVVCVDNRSRAPFYAYFHLGLGKFLAVPDGDVIAYQYI